MVSKGEGWKRCLRKMASSRELRLENSWNARSLARVVPTGYPRPLNPH